MRKSKLSKLISPTEYEDERELLQLLAQNAQYRGIAPHKKKAKKSDHGNTRSAPAKSLCCDVGLHDEERALNLLRTGLRLGLVSRDKEAKNGPEPQQSWPKHVWAIVDLDAGPCLLEAAFDREAYHGYPVFPDHPQYSEPVFSEIKRRWNNGN